MATDRKGAECKKITSLGHRGDPGEKERNVSDMGVSGGKRSGRIAGDQGQGEWQNAARWDDRGEGPQHRPKQACRRPD